MWLRPKFAFKYKVPACQIDHPFSSLERTIVASICLSDSLTLFQKTICIMYITILSAEYFMWNINGFRERKIVLGAWVL